MLDNFRKKIASVTVYRESRDQFTNEIINNPSVFPELISLLFEISNKDHVKACWIIELICYQKLEWMQEHLSIFCSKINTLRDESAIRPIAKVCQLLVISHYKKGVINLSKNQLEEIIETSFDWLINDTKVASKAYSMRTLYVLGQHYDWIHPELKTIITKDFPNHSAAYKAVAKEVLKKIK